MYTLITMCLRKINDKTSSLVKYLSAVMIVNKSDVIISRNRTQES